MKGNTVVNDFEEFKRPEHYIRHIGTVFSLYPRCRTLKQGYVEPLESELARQVEYDMDEQGASLPVLTWSYWTKRIQIRNGWTS